MITIIVSRYNEDISWLYSIVDNILLEKIIVFNKGEDEIISNHYKIQIKKVPNTGREGGTYLDYILNNYDNFPENLIFTQADPFDHNEEFLEFFKYKNIDYVIKNEDFLSLTRYYRKDWPFKHGKDYNSFVLNNFICNNYLVDKYSLNIIGPCSAIDETQAFKNRLKNYNHVTGSFIDFLCDFLKITCPKKIINFNMAACFFVKSKQILRHPKKVYIKLNKFLYNTDSQGGGEGYILERFWDYLLTGKSYDTIHESYTKLLQNIFPFVCIYCTIKKKLYIKNIEDCSTIVEDRNKFLIYKYKDNDKDNDIIKILPCIDYLGPNISTFPCYSIEDSKKIYTELKKKYFLLLTKSLIRDASPVFYFYIRGHIRSSFTNNKLRFFLNKIKIKFPNVIFILQTWDNSQCDLSLTWRTKPAAVNKNFKVTKETLNNYFNNIVFSSIIIDEDSIKLNGEIEGNIIKAPKKGWKNMWYGINKGLENLTNNSNIPIVVFRYDYFDLGSLFRNGDEDEVIHFIENNIYNNKIAFNKKKGAGCDNLFMGPLNKIKVLSKNFNYNLDSIISYDFNVKRQENLVTLFSNFLN